MVTFIPAYQKREFLHRLLHRKFSICYDFQTFHLKIDYLKTILMKTFKSLLNKLYTSKVIVQDVPKRNVLLELPLFKSTLFQNQKTLQKLFIDNLKFKNRFYVTC